MECALTCEMLLWTAWWPNAEAVGGSRGNKTHFLEDNYPNDANSRVQPPDAQKTLLPVQPRPSQLPKVIHGPRGGLCRTIREKTALLVQTCCCLVAAEQCV